MVGLCSSGGGVIYGRSLRHETPEKNQLKGLYHDPQLQVDGCLVMTGSAEVLDGWPCSWYQVCLSMSKQ